MWSADTGGSRSGEGALFSERKLRRRGNDGTLTDIQITDWPNGRDLDTRWRRDDGGVHDGRAPAIHEMRGVGGWGRDGVIQSGHDAVEVGGGSQWGGRDRQARPQHLRFRRFF